MLHLATPGTGSRWANQGNVYGSFDWKKIGFSVTIPADATTGTLHLGLQDSSGTSWFDDVQASVLLVPEPRPLPRVDPEPAFRGHDLPRLRGVMSPTAFREDDLRVLGQDWKANLIRWQIQRNWGKPGTDRDLAEYDRWIEGKLDELDKVLESCRKHGIKLVIDLHTPPGGRREDSDLAIFHERKYQDHFVKLWETIARRYKGHAAVWGYDLVNEPVQNEPSPEGLGDYLVAQVRAARAMSPSWGKRWSCTPAAMPSTWPCAILPVSDRIAATGMTPKDALVGCHRPAGGHRVDAAAAGKAGNTDHGPAVISEGCKFVAPKAAIPLVPGWLHGPPLSIGLYRRVIAS